MIRSMTGFGSATVEFLQKTISVEIKSVNSKFFDLTLRLPPFYREKEMELRVEEELGTALYGGVSTVSANSSSSSRRPGKASDKQRQNISLLSGGPSVAGNRDRIIPIGMLSPSERTKLPAPPIGYTMGHGLMQTGSPTDKGTGIGGSTNFSVSSNNSKFDTSSKNKNNNNNNTVLRTPLGSIKSGQGRQ